MEKMFVTVAISVISIILGVLGIKYLIKTIQQLMFTPPIGQPWTTIEPSDEVKQRYIEVDPPALAYQKFCILRNKYHTSSKANNVERLSKELLRVAVSGIPVAEWINKEIHMINTLVERGLMRQPEILLKKAEVEGFNAQLNKLRIEAQRLKPGWEKTFFMDAMIAYKTEMGTMPKKECCKHEKHDHSQSIVAPEKSVQSLQKDIEESPSVATD